MELPKEPHYSPRADKTRGLPGERADIFPFPASRSQDYNKLSNI